MGINNYVHVFYGINHPCSIRRLRQLLHQAGNENNEQLEKVRQEWLDSVGNDEMIEGEYENREFQTDLEHSEYDITCNEKEFWEYDSERFCDALGMNGCKLYVIRHKDEEPCYYFALARFGIHEWGYGCGPDFDIDYEKKVISYRCGGSEDNDNKVVECPVPSHEEMQRLKHFAIKLRSVQPPNVGFVAISEYN